MGRGKIEIKRIENSTNRQVTYTKRKNGILKKAKEITVLCDARVSLVIFATSGKMVEYCSPSTNLIGMLDRYQKHSGKRLWDAKHENLSNEIERIKKENDSMQIELRHLKGEDITSLQIKELMAIEAALENGLSSIGDRKKEFLKDMRKTGQDLEEQNLQLNYVLQQQQQQHMAAMNGNVRSEMENGYEQQGVGVGEYQMPFAFRVQPMQPNLHDRI